MNTEIAYKGVVATMALGMKKGDTLPPPLKIPRPGVPAKEPAAGEATIHDFRRALLA